MFCHVIQFYYILYYIIGCGLYALYILAPVQGRLFLEKNENPTRAQTHIFIFHCGSFGENSLIRCQVINSVCRRNANKKA